MDYDLKDISGARARALFSVGDTVTIKIYDKDGTDVTPANPADECSPYGELDTFQWSYSNLVTLPKLFQEYSWVMTNQTGSKQRDVDSFSSVPNTVFLLPFGADIEKTNINKGDSFEPEFRVDINAQDLLVAVELTDMVTTINKYTSNIVGGGDDQVLLISDTATYKIYRLFVTGTETDSFDSRFVDMTITAQTQGGQTQTIKNKIPFTVTPSIKFDKVD